MTAPAVVVPETLEEFAAAARTLADWADDQIAGGKPAKWVAAQMVAGTQYLATAARKADEDGWWLA